MNSRLAVPAINVILVISYGVALVVLARLLPVLRERRIGWFLTLEIATGGLVAGHLLAGRPPAAAINAAAIAGFAAAWWWTGRRLRRGAPGPPY